MTRFGSGLASCLCLLLVAPGPGVTQTMDKNGYLQLGGNLNVFEECKDRPFVYLLRESKVRVAAQETQLSLRDVIAVTSMEGRRRGTRTFVLPKSTKPKKLQGMHVTPGGVLVPMRDEDIRRKEIGNWVEYTIAMPQVEVGSIIDIGYEYKLPYPMSYYEFTPASQEPVMHARFVGGCDDLVALTMISINCEKERVTERVDGDPKEDAGSYQFDFYDVKPISDERLAPPVSTYAPHLILYAEGRKNWERTTSNEDPIWKLVNTRRNWNYAVIWEEPILRQVCSLDESDEAHKLVGSLTKGCKTAEAKTAAILRFVRDEILVVGSQQRGYPQPAVETFEARTGTVNDVAGVTIAMLRLAGVDVSLALARTHSAGEWRPMLYSTGQFNHLLALVHGDASDYWLDPACRACGPDELDWDVRGSSGILFAANINADMQRIFAEGQKAESEQDFYRQVSNAIHNARWTEIVYMGHSQEWEPPSRIGTTRAILQQDGVLAGTLHLALTGDAKLEARRELISGDESARQRWCENVLKDRFEVAELREHHLEGIEPSLNSAGAFDTLHVNLRFEIPGFLGLGRTAILPASSFAPPLADPVGGAPRRTDIWQPQSQGERDDTFLELPADAQLTGLPPPVQLTGQFLRYEFKAENEGRLLHLRRVLTRRRAVLPAASAAEVRAEFAAVLAADKLQIEIVAAKPTNPTR